MTLKEFSFLRHVFTALLIFTAVACQKTMDIAQLKVNSDDELFSLAPLTAKDLYFDNDSLILYTIPHQSQTENISKLVSKIKLIFDLRGKTALTLANYNDKDKNLASIFKGESYPLKLQPIILRSYLKNHDGLIFLKILKNNTPIKSNSKTRFALFAYNRQGDLLGEKVVFPININPDINDIGYARLKLAKFIENTFPLMGFVLQVRGSQTAAMISLGRTAGVIKGQKFALYDSTKEGKQKSIRKIPTATDIASLGAPYATITVHLVTEDSSWFFTKKEITKPVKIGDLVISIP